MRGSTGKTWDVLDDVSVTFRLYASRTNEVLVNVNCRALKNHDDEYWEGNQIICHQIELFEYVWFEATLFFADGCEGQSILKICLLKY